jgi:glycosyltransferase involved in cell wall biosynthesis
VNPGLDLEVFKPVDKQLSRKILGFSDDDIIILFGAISATSDFNKGFHLLLPALQRLQSTLPNLKLVVFGSDDSGENLINIDIPIKYVGRLHDDISLTILYSSADVMVVPSIQEAFGQTASESFACGTPVVAFGASGLIDIIDHKVNGYLAKPYDSVDLAEGIKWVIEDKDRNFNLSIKARIKAMNNFGLDRFVNKYVDIYNSIINKGK